MLRREDPLVRLHDLGRLAEGSEADPVPRTRDVVVIGASAGGIEVLTAMAAQLPEDFTAALFVVVHVSADHRSFLPEILNRVGVIPAAHATNGEAIRGGRFYVAPPDSHMLVKKGRVRVTYGPRENGHRPAVDPLFRSAALAYGQRVVGVLLSGALDDGTAGLGAIKQRGGTAIVLDPADAKYPSMPASAIDSIEVDQVVRLADLAPTLVRVIREPVLTKASTAGDAVDTVEEDMLLQGRPPSGDPAGLTCPECHGALFRSTDDGTLRFQCHVGHRFSPESLAAAQSNELEGAMWAALRSLEESARLATQLADRSAERGRARSEAHFRTKAEELADRAAVVRRVLIDDDAGPRPQTDPDGVDVLRGGADQDDDLEAGG